MKKEEEKLEHKTQRRFAKIKTGQDKIIQELQKQCSVDFKSLTEAEKVKLAKELGALQAMTACGKVDVQQFLMKNKRMHNKIQELSNAG